MNNIIVLIPSFNPSKKLLNLVNNLLVNNFKVLIVNDGSDSLHNNIFAHLPKDVILLKHSSNKGKGAAIKTGLQYIQDNLNNYTGVITADSDNKYSINEILKISKELKRSENYILGCRKFPKNLSLKYKIGNAVLKYAFTAACGKKLKDTQTGLRGFRTTLIPELLKIEGTSYDYETNVLLYIMKLQIEIKEIDIDTLYYGNTSSKHFHPIRDSIKIYSRMIKFALSSFMAFSLDFIALLFFKSITANLIPEFSLLISVIAARFISSTFNFLINKNFVFKHYDKSSNNHLAVKYYSVVILMLCMNYTLINLLDSYIHIPLVFAKILTELCLFFINFALQKKIVFKEEVLEA